MSDPVAQIVDKVCYSWNDDCCWETSRESVREAYSPIRELFDRLAQDYVVMTPEVQKGMDLVLNPLRELIFTGEELGQ